MRRTIAAAGGLLLVLTATACNDDAGSGSGAGDPALDALVTEVEALDGVEGATTETQDVEGEGIHSLDVSVELAPQVTEAQATAVLDLLFEEAPAAAPGRDVYVHVDLAGTTVYLLDHELEDPEVVADALLTGHTLAALGKVEIGSTPPSITVRLPEGSGADEVSAAVEEALAADVSPGIDVNVWGDGAALTAGGGLGAEVLEQFRDLAATTADVEGFEIDHVSLTVDPSVEGPGRLSGDVEIELPGHLTPRDVTPDAFQDVVWPMLTDQLDVVAGWEDGATFSLVNVYHENEGAIGRDYMVHVINGPGADKPDRRGWNALAEGYLESR